VGSFGHEILSSAMVVEPVHSTLPPLPTTGVLFLMIVRLAVRTAAGATAGRSFTTTSLSTIRTAFLVHIPKGRHSGLHE